MPGRWLNATVPTEAASGWSKTECNSALTHGHDDFGVTAIRLAALAQLRHRGVHGAGTGVEVTVPAAVAPVGPLGRASPVLGAADGISVRAHQRVDERREQLAEQVRRGLGQLLVQKPGRVDTGCGGQLAAERGIATSNTSRHQ